VADAPTHPYEILDVFTDVPLQGNPLAVFTDGAAVAPELMQRTARELNLSETVFVLPDLAHPNGADARVRIFTPTAELPFAGHPVLGTAFSVGRLRSLDVVRLRTGSGVVPVALRRDAGGQIVFGEMEQPIPSIEPYADVDTLLLALGVRASGLPVELYDNGPRFVYVALPDAAAVAGLRPDLRAIADLGAIGVSCFAVDGSASTVKTRMFGPGLGVAEDPATGSAAGPLAVHLALHGAIAFGQRIEISQGAEIGRPSVIHACAFGARAQVERVTVGGSAVLVARGHFRL
jgi:trans-2,3-dihydro-3-hydroxyanthranilate isomerase